MAEEKREIVSEKTGSGSKVVETTKVEPAPEEKKEMVETRNVFQINYLIYYLLGVIEVLLAFRLVFKMTGANPNSGFVSFMYTITSGLVAPFAGIFNGASGQGNVTSAVFEPATLVAMVVYLLIGWGLAKLLGSFMAGKQESK